MERTQVDLSYMIQIGELYLVNALSSRSVELHADKYYAYEFALGDYENEKQLVEKLEEKVDSLYKQGLSAKVIQVKKTTIVKEEAKEMNFYTFGELKTLVTKDQSK
ncbi:hypothetical protein [Priestia megaterium]|uniref:hypothetical protein n=1 Tax=Priestia megaterium TaxID=1404 RepID=UPI000BFB715B|nr:hypothetical protein [Priestia megaterium]PGO60685.1 hypothetical protein CN981_09040 [Priestia megaterium]